jgi:L,D-transpeptidase ErfK/SrfK
VLRRRRRPLGPNTLPRAGKPSISAHIQRVANPYNGQMLRILSFVAALTGVVPSVWAADYWLTEGQEVIGDVQVISARHEDTFVALARTYDVGYEELKRANPDVDAWLPGEGTQITIPTRFVLPHAAHRGIVVNVAELRLYYFPADSGPRPEGVPAGARRVVTHPISIGRMDWSTPLGTTSVTNKVANPSWYPPQSIREEHAARDDILPRVVPPGPDNPLGKHALRLGLPGYLIHGTNKPSGIGMRVTHGCIRMFPEDIEALYRNVPAGTSVEIVNQPVKLGWADGSLYLESHPPLPESEIDGEDVSAANEQASRVEESPLTSLMRAYIAATQNLRIDWQWDAAEHLTLLGSGVPEIIPVNSVMPLAANQEN